MQCVHLIHFIGKCFFFTNFFIHHILIMVQDKYGFYQPNQASGKLLDCLLACISPGLMFVFLISLTSISQFQSGGPLFFNVTGNNSFLLCPRYLAQVNCMKISQLKSSVRKLFRSNTLSPHLHKLNACGVCIIIVKRGSAHNSMLHKRLK